MMTGDISLSDNCTPDRCRVHAVPVIAMQNASLGGRVTNQRTKLDSPADCNDRPDKW